VSPACTHETECYGQDEAVVMFPEEGRVPGVANRVAPLAACYAFQARAQRSILLQGSPGSSGEGLASEPRQGISLPCLPRLKRWRKSPAEALPLPSSPSLKSPAVRRCKIDPKLPRRPTQCQDGVRKLSALNRQRGRQSMESNILRCAVQPTGIDDVSSETGQLLMWPIRKNLCPGNQCRYTSH
jgi:hypothetical protein